MQSELTSRIRCLSSWSVRKLGLYELSVVVLPVPANDGHTLSVKLLAHVSMLLLLKTINKIIF